MQTQQQLSPRSPDQRKVSRQRGSVMISAAIAISLLILTLTGTELGYLGQVGAAIRKEEAKADEALDLVMLTNGYRYFELLPEIQKTKKFPFQKEELILSS